MAVSPARVIVVIAGSAGALGPLQSIVSSLPSDLPGAVVVLLHRRPSSGPDSMLARILSRTSRLPVTDATDGDLLEEGHVYVAKADLHLVVDETRKFAYVDGRRIRFVLSSANPLFESSAQVFGRNTIAVVLSGSGSDGTDGVQTIKACGGTVIAQDPATAIHVGMPTAAVSSGAVDYALPLERIAPAVVRLTRERAHKRSDGDGETSGGGARLEAV